MSIYDKIRRVGDRAATLEIKQGHPLRRTLMIRTLSIAGASYAPTVEDFLVRPVPKITTPSPRLIGLSIGSESQAIEITANDYVAEVSRSIGRDRFVRGDSGRVVVFVDVQVDSLGNVRYGPNNLTPLGGVEGRIIHVDDRDCCNWKILIRRMRDK
jgi:hypothetical protein